MQAYGPVIVAAAATLVLVGLLAILLADVALARLRDDATADVQPPVTPAAVRDAPALASPHKTTARQAALLEFSFVSRVHHIQA
jgi:hypothetical protein